MNENEIGRVAAAAHALRPDWPLASIRTLITTKLADRPRRDVAVALAWVACESGSATPARVLEAGPWWRAAGVETNGLPPRPPKPAEACRTCGRHMHAADATCDTPTLRPVTSTPPPVTYLDARRRPTQGEPA